MSDIHQEGGPAYEVVERAAKRLGQSFVWVGPEHPEYGSYLVDLCRQTGAKRIVEFGAQCGGSALPLARYCKQVGGRLDLYDIGVEKGSDTLAICMEAIRQSGLDDVVTAHRGDVREQKIEGTVDFVHLDHDKDDYERAFGVVRDSLSERGIVAFHDADDHAREQVGRIARKFELEFNHYIVGGCAVYRKGKFWPLNDVAVQVLTHKEGPFLRAVLQCVYDKARVVIVLEDVNPMFGDVRRSEWRTEDEVNAFKQEHPDAVIHFVEANFGQYGGPHQEAQRRNEANRIAREEYDCRYSWIVDADEIYEESEARGLWAWFRQQNVEAARCGWYTYWRSLHWRVEPPESFHPYVIVRADRQATLCREFAVNSECVVPHDVCMVRHYSWVRTPAEIQRKIQGWGHAHQVIDGWFDEVFMQWSPGCDMQDLHPTEPKAYQSIVRCSEPIPHALVNHPWRDFDIVDDCRVKVVVLHHNQPEQADALYGTLAGAFDGVELLDCGSDPDKVPMHLTVSLPNVYWEGAWLEAMERWKDCDVIWVVGADIQLDEDAASYRRAIETAMPFGCWSPAIHGRAHPFMHPELYAGQCKRVKNVEGMALAVSGKLVRAMGAKFDVSTKIGFGQDYWLCAKARQRKMPNYVDGSVTVHHPAAIGYNEQEAHDLMEQAFSERFGANFRRTLFDYDQSFEGNLFKERDMSDKLTIVTVENGWGIKEFERVTSEFTQCRRLVMRKGISDFSAETSAEVIEYDEEMTEVLDADIAVFPRVGSANHQEFERVFAAGIPIVANVNHHGGRIEHEKDGLLYGNESWALGWIRQLVADEGLRLRIGGAAAQKARQASSEHDKPAAVKPVVVSEPQAETSQDVTATVITPTFRRDPRVVSRCIDCVRLQTMGSLEHIVCSDGAHEAQIEALVKSVNDDRLSYHHLEAKKPGDFGNVVRNEMLKMAKGKYIFFFDDDNLVLPDYLETMIDAIEKSGKDFAVCEIVHFGPLMEQEVGAPPKVLSGEPVKLYHVDTLQVVVKREAMQDVGWDTEHGYLSDGHTLQALDQKFEHVRVPRVLGFHV